MDWPLGDDDCRLDFRRDGKKHDVARVKSVMRSHDPRSSAQAPLRLVPRAVDSLEQAKVRALRRAVTRIVVRIYAACAPWLSARGQPSSLIAAANLRNVPTTMPVGATARLRTSGCTAGQYTALYQSTRDGAARCLSRPPDAEAGSTADARLRIVPYSRIRRSAS